MNSWVVEPRVKSGSELGVGSGMALDSVMVGVKALTVLGVLRVGLRADFVVGLVFLGVLMVLICLAFLVVLAVLAVDLDLIGAVVTV